VVDASKPRLKRQLGSWLSRLPPLCGLEIRDTLGSFREDFNHDFGSVKTKYAIFFLADHVLETQSDDFLSDCALALEMNQDVYQIHLAGPYAEWTVERKLLFDSGFRNYVQSHNPFRIPFYPWFRIDEDRLWYGGRLLYSKGIPKPGNPLQRRVIVPSRIALWVSPPAHQKEDVVSQATFIAGGGAKHLALAFNGAPCFYNMDIFKNYLPIPENVRGSVADVGELYFYRETDLDRTYGVGWLNAQSFFWHDDYGWSLTNETSRSLFREIMLRKLV
jgi:hypothetical protein